MVARRCAGAENGARKGVRAVPLCELSAVLGVRSGVDHVIKLCRPR